LTLRIPKSFKNIGNLHGATDILDLLINGKNFSAELASELDSEQLFIDLIFFMDR